MTKFCVTHCRVELNDNVTGLDALSILNVNCSNHTGLERLNDLGSAAWDDLPRCCGDNIGRPERRQATHMDARFGRFTNTNMAEYMIPVNLDVPVIDVTFLNDPDPFINPIGVKGVGEIGITGVAAAGLLACAIHALLNDGPVAVVSDNEAVEVEIETILYCRAVNFRYQAARLRESGPVDTDTVAYNQFLWRVS